jgi:molybdopterin-containing oxidoreductase family iron-sulfur binding subunit
MALGGYGVGMLVESHEGRPTKAEGNPLHPASGGALGTVHQASVLELYDPTRSRQVTRDGMPSTWSAFAAAISAKPQAGKRTHVLLEPTSAPHVIDLVQRLRARGDVTIHFDAPLAPSSAWSGAAMAFGSVVEPRWDFSRADVVLALDADFLGTPVGPLTWMRSWAARRRLDGPADTMSRLYVVEARLSVTGMAADDRLRIQARQIPAIAAELLAQIVALGGAAIPPEVAAVAARPPGPHSRWTSAVARDLKAHAGASIVIAGDGQPAEVHALAHAMNGLLGNFRHTVTYGPSSIFEAGQDSHDLGDLVRALQAGTVDTLLAVGGDPAYTAPADLDLPGRIRLAKTTAFIGARDNQTARICAWFAPEAHFLEAWGDARAFDGTASIAQPLLSPSILGSNQSRTVGQAMAALLGTANASSRELVEQYWRAHAPPGDFDGFWQGALVHGVVPGSATSVSDVRVDWRAISRVLAVQVPPPAPLEIIYFADSKVYDGRFGDNAALQELADPVTKLTWDNAALVGPATAERMGLADADVVEIEVRGRTLRAPALICPSMADDVVAIALGYGQSVPDRVSFGAGANAYGLRDSRALWADDATLRKQGGSWKLAITQEHWTMEGRPIVIRHTIEHYRESPDFAAPMNEPGVSLYGLTPPGAHQWGMTVDLNACTGCSACVVACMAENNIPVVGKAAVRLSREMHWLRIDRYFVGDARDAAAVVQPMLCQHCEKAPCEYVCPVNATVHSSDGLNEMIYNRCVGTRFCSNNCPYKVRRFNFFNYNRDKPQSLQLAMNPDVTVRARGVMEKCTYCVQRIREVEIRARREQRPIADGEILTACQQTCPTEALVFGDIADPTTKVAQTRKSDRLYAVLHELGTAPRTRYLARVTNPNPDLGRS